MNRRRRRKPLNEIMRELIITIRLLITIVLYCFAFYIIVRILLYIVHLL